MLHIQKASEGFTTHIKVLIYGSAGTGKTSLAGTTEAPLIFNFGNSGSHRAIGAKDTVRIDHWWQTQDVFTPEFLSQLEGYRTIILDDVGTMQSLIVQSVIAQGGFYVQNNVLSQAGYGQLKEVFTQFMARLNTLQKDIVLVAHDTGEAIGDRNNKFVNKKPDISGSAYKYLVRDFDLIGHLGTTKGERSVDFTPSSVLVAKTFLPGVPKMAVPHFEAPEYSTTLARLITSAKERINAKSEVAKVVENYRNFIDSFSNPADFSTLGEQLKKDESVKNNLQALIRNYAKSRMEALGIEYNKEAKSFKFKEGYDQKEPKTGNETQEKEAKPEEVAQKPKSGGRRVKRAS